MEIKSPLLTGIEVKESIDFSKLKICKRCGHKACPYCLDWCDIILYSKNDAGFHSDLNDDDYPYPCCDGQCIYE